MSKERVLVAMSGGVDSSVAAILLKEQGYDVVGITMKVWDYASCNSKTKEVGCCNLDSINDAREVAVRLGFPHYVADFTEIFKEKIISNFIDEYLQARTPNPCVLCNSLIKWNALLEKARQLDCAYIATGHYARILKLNGRYFLSKGKDESKDQSYVLWGLSQENLRSTLFPLGDIEKKEVREIAEKAGFKQISKKGESYEICFIPDNDYRTFLKNNVSDFDSRFPQGNFVLTNGKIVGKHKGLPFYTIGQRKGLEIAFSEPLYVKELRPQTNEVVLGIRSELYSTTLQIKNFVLSKYEQLSEKRNFIVKIRYRDTGNPASVVQIDDTLWVEFEEPVFAITPGQSAVIYEGDDVVGGGIIYTNH